MTQTTLGIIMVALAIGAALAVLVPVSLALLDTWREYRRMILRQDSWCVTFVRVHPDTRVGGPVVFSDGRPARGLNVVDFEPSTGRVWYVLDGLADMAAVATLSLDHGAVSNRRAP